MFVALMATLGVSKENLTPYRGSDLSGFNGSKTRPLGYIELIVTHGNEALAQTVKTLFLFIPCPSIYNCIIGRPTLGRLEDIASIIHLKMKFYSVKDEIITINIDLGTTQRCHFLSLKKDLWDLTSKTLKEGLTKKKQGKEPKINLVALSNQPKEKQTVEIP